eukprot:COSAG02_NODE_6248_length_3700_cov_3.058039_4_plen_65_part_00
MVFAHVRQRVGSTRGVRPHVGVALSWGYAHARQHRGRWQQLWPASRFVRRQPPLRPCRVVFIRG